MTASILVGWMQCRVAGALLQASCPSSINDDAYSIDVECLKLFNIIGNQLIHILMSCRHSVGRFLLFNFFSISVLLFCTLPPDRAGNRSYSYPLVAFFGKIISRELVLAAFVFHSVYCGYHRCSTEFVVLCRFQ